MKIQSVINIFEIKFIKVQCMEILFSAKTVNITMKQVPITDDNKSNESYINVNISETSSL